MLGDDWAPEGFEQWTNERGSWEVVGETDRNWPWTDGLRHLVDCAEPRRPTVTRPEHAYHALEVMLAAKRSAKEGRVIEIESTFPALDYSGAGDSGSRPPPAARPPVDMTARTRPGRSSPTGSSGARRRRRTRSRAAWPRTAAARASGTLQPHARAASRTATPATSPATTTTGGRSDLDLLGAARARGRTASRWPGRACVPTGRRPGQRGRAGLLRPARRRPARARASTRWSRSTTGICRSALEDDGGWLARDTAWRFAEYAGVVAGRLGDRVRRFSTFNEPYCTALARVRRRRARARGCAASRRR